MTVKIEKNDNSTIITIDYPKNLPIDHTGYLGEIMSTVADVVEHYIENIVFLSKADRKDATQIELVMAQNMKAQIYLHECLKHVILGSSAANGSVNAIDLGFPELN